VKVHKKFDGKLALEGDEQYTVNQGMLCSKGMNLHHTVMDTTDRLLYPQVRYNRSMPLERVHWDEALTRASDVFKALINKYGPDSVGFYVSGQCLTEEYYVANKITKGFIGTNNIDTNSRLCMSSAVAGYKQTLGEDTVPVCYDDIELSDCFLISGANPAWCHPILFRRLEKYKLENPSVKVIVVDPRKTQSTSIADLHLQINPGTDVVLHHVIARLLIERGAVDKSFIAQSTNGYEAFKNKVFERSVEEACAECGIDWELLDLAVQYIQSSKAMITMWAMGLNQSVIGVNKNVSLINLNLITGNIGRPGAGPFSLTGQPNAMGGREVGGLANLLPAHYNLMNEDHRKLVESFWGGTKIQDKPGLTATEMFDKLHSGEMKAIWIICTNPLVSLPNTRKVEEALKRAKFVVVQDISQRSDTVAFADVVLPAAGFMEKEGVMTNSERRMSYLQKVIDPPGEAKPDLDILLAFAHKMGWGKSFSYKGNAGVFEEFALLTKNTNVDISALTYEKLKQNRSMRWPVTLENPNGTDRLFTDHQFYTDNKKANIVTVVDDTNQSSKPDDSYSLILTTGRIRDQWHTMTRTGKVNKLKTHIEKAFLEIHPHDAQVRNIHDNDLIEIYSTNGNIRMRAKITDTIKQGVVFAPMHWGKLLRSDLHRTNNVTNTLVDPQSKEPDFKYTCVEVQLYQKKKERIVIVGAGAGAAQFIKTYRQLNTTDEIKVLSGEVNPFYNRVLLPEYYSKHKEWKDIQKFQQDDLSKLGVTIVLSNVKEVNHTQNEVIDQHGSKHSYDKLILATGSSAFRIPSLPKLSGIYTIRKHQDVEALQAQLVPGDEVVIVGGGLLGLEMADALQYKGMKVSIVQRSSRLMDKQLDYVSSNLLARMLQERGMDIYFNDEILYVNGSEKIDSIRLKSSKRIECKAMILAIGTVPNIDFIKQSGIKCNKGVVVNSYLETSAPNVYAIGEIAEYNGQLFGITAGAEEQADVVCNTLLGDPGAIYNGTLSMNILKVHGMDLCSIGKIEVPKNDEAYEEIVVQDLSRNYYKKCIVHNERLVGAILIGDKNEFLEFKKLIQEGTELGDLRDKLLRGAGNPKPPVKGKLVCSCNSVGDGNIEDAITDGCNTLELLCNTTGAGMGCGSCKPEVLALLKKNTKENEVKGERTHA
jgi:ferredoxin-nitrate reductase